MSKTKSNSKIRLAYCISKLEKKQLAGLLLVLCFFMHTTEITPTIRYVSKTGSSTPPYTSWETAADSIQKCINISNSGDTIYVANETYFERVIMIPGLNLIGGGMDSCIINSTGVTQPPGTFAVRMTDTCYLSNFRIIPSASSTTGRGVEIYDVNYPFIQATVEYIRVENGIYGIRISSSSIVVDHDTKMISNNIILNSKDGIVSAQTTPLIKDNLINVKETGLKSQVISSPTYINNTVVFDQNGHIGFDDFGNISVLKNNLFVLLNGKSGDYGMFTYSDTLINNVVLGNFQRGVLSSGSIIKNNSISNSGDGVYYDIGGGPPPLLQYNNVWQNGTNYRNINPDSTNISFDPMFVNPDSLDFHLQLFSPLIDAGDPEILDKDDSRSDIGLFGGPFGDRYSYQDLPPRPPVNFMAVIDTNLLITLKWNKNTEADFEQYRIYRDTTSEFIIDSTKLISEQADTFYIETALAGYEKIYYKITAADSQDNESLPSEELSVIISSIDNAQQVIYDYILYQNYPNPFNPSTLIGFRLKERGFVKLYIYDIKGEMVETLINGNREGGYHEIEFRPKSNLSSGIYFYQIMIKSENNIPVFTDLKKLIYLK